MPIEQHITLGAALVLVAMWCGGLWLFFRFAMALVAKIAADEVIERVKNLHHDTEVRLKMEHCWSIICGNDTSGANGIRTYIICSARRVWKELGDERELVITDTEIYVEGVKK